MTHPIEILAGTSHMNDVLFTAVSGMLIVSPIVPKS
jgi:hypothetical protein